MAAVIRLSRAGKRNGLKFSIIVSEKAYRRDGEILEFIGTYDPRAKEDKDKVRINRDLLQKWIARGALPSETVSHLMKIPG